MERKRKNANRVKAKTIDEYLAALSDDKRAALQQLRKNILAAVPRAEECINYQLPAFRLDGRMPVWFGATANHCAFYPGAVVEDYKDELGDYGTSKGTIRFSAGKSFASYPGAQASESSDRKERRRSPLSSEAQSRNEGLTGILYGITVTQWH